MTNERRLMESVRIVSALKPEGNVLYSAPRLADETGYRSADFEII
jgi:hypothetical protein